MKEPKERKGMVPDSWFASVVLFLVSGGLSGCILYRFIFGEDYNDLSFERGDDGDRG
ncbi:hypothetical protein [Roseibacillus persicicus]|uniref:hypothetical protein n=1 Tax=Roseibacillus persicicus TaxID=454148 RepID=UPI001676BD27|nr:hypothetical protein [Roseibacillus persicicus]